MLVNTNNIYLFIFYHEYIFIYWKIFKTLQQWIMWKSSILLHPQPGVYFFPFHYILENNLYTWNYKNIGLKMFFIFSSNIKRRRINLDFTIWLCNDVLLEVLCRAKRFQLVKLEYVGLRFHMNIENFFNIKPFLRHHFIIVRLFLYRISTTIKLVIRLILVLAF